MNQRKFSRLEKALMLAPLVALAIALVRWDALLPRLPQPVVVFFHPSGRRWQDGCENKSKNIALGFMQYTADYGSYPPVKGGRGRATGWVDSLQPYMGGYTLFICPGAPFPPKWIAAYPERNTYYWMNCNLSGLCKSRVASPATTLLIGDGIPTADTSYAKTVLPPGWLKDHSSPLYRHLRGANYTFADAHTKWMTPDEMLALDARGHIFLPK